MKASEVEISKLKEQIKQLKDKAVMKEQEYILKEEKYDASRKEIEEYKQEQIRLFNEVQAQIVKQQQIIQMKTDDGKKIQELEPKFEQFSETELLVQRDKMQSEIA